MKKRDLFAELMQGVEEMGEHRKGKIILRQYEMEGTVSVRQENSHQSGHTEELGAVKAECPGSIAD